MQNSGDTGLWALIIVAGISLFGVIQGFFVSQRTKQEQLRTNSRLRDIEKAQADISKMSGKMEAMSNDLHMIKESLLEKNK